MHHNTYKISHANNAYASHCTLYLHKQKCLPTIIPSLCETMCAGVSFVNYAALCNTWCRTMTLDNIIIFQPLVINLCRFWCTSRRCCAQYVCLNGPGEALHGWSSSQSNSEVESGPCEEGGFEICCRHYYSREHTEQRIAVHYHTTGRRQPGRPHKRCKWSRDASKGLNPKNKKKKKKLFRIEVGERSKSARFFSKVLFP